MPNAAHRGAARDFEAGVGYLVWRRRWQPGGKGDDESRKMGWLPMLVIMMEVN